MNHTLAFSLLAAVAGVVASSAAPAQATDTATAGTYTRGIQLRRVSALFRCLPALRCL